MKNKRLLSTAIAATLGATTADAATYAATLVSAGQYQAGGGLAGLNITSSTATWSYNDVSGLLTQTGGTFNARLTTIPTSTLFRHSITGLVMGAGGAATASSYVCAEGNFGGNVGASICGNYNFGANFVHESAISYGPGTAAARTLGGDDVALGPQQSLNGEYNGSYDAFYTVSWVGTALTLSNARCGTHPAGYTACVTLGGFNSGYRWILDAGPPATVPVPAALWLFGGALGALGWLKRQQKTAG